MSSIQLTDTDRAELIRLGQLTIGTTRYDSQTDKNVVVPNLAYQLPENLRIPNDRHSQH